MFNKLKQFKQMRDQAKTLQNTLAEEHVDATAAWNNIKIRMGGNLNVESVEIDPSLLAPDQKKKLQDGLQEAFNDAVKKVQKIMASKLRDQGGLDMFKS
ncbi:MAG: YbaB/EbfC family nucleoid-associated protein [Candidatus Magasanikbacteria bacterium]|nr:YbaB/EbfC family nucleoid-associated protein [Candidatus Magasanikbacteria bacterium]